MKKEGIKINTRKRGLVSKIYPLTNKMKVEDKNTNYRVKKPRQCPRCKTYKYEKAKK